jgi:hypothetical protein
MSPNATPMFWLAFGVAGENNWTVWWSSGYDRKHGGKSKHYIGDAWDFQFFDDDGNDVSYQAGQQMAERNKCPDYDIVPKIDHAHTEYDAERPGQEARRFKEDLLMIRT